MRKGRLSPVNFPVQSIPNRAPCGKKGINNPRRCPNIVGSVTPKSSPLTSLREISESAAYVFCTNPAPGDSGILTMRARVFPGLPVFSCWRSSEKEQSVKNESEIDMFRKAESSASSFNTAVPKLFLQGRPFIFAPPPGALPCSNYTGSDSN